jgi:hypothetical protein
MNLMSNAFKFVVYSRSLLFVVQLNVFMYFIPEWLTTTQTHLFDHLLPARIQVTKFPPPPMWDPQMWQAQGLDPTQASIFY